MLEVLNDLIAIKLEKQASTVKAASSMKMVMAIVFWDASGVLLIDHFPNGQTINADRYIATLKINK